MKRSILGVAWSLGRTSVLAMLTFSSALGCHTAEDSSEGSSVEAPSAGAPGVAKMRGGPPPSFGPAASADRPPAPLSGGTLRVLADGYTAVAADPDRDELFVVDLKKMRRLASLTVPQGSEPGRIIQDRSGLVHVVLRRGGAVVTVDPRTWTITAQRPICAAPRGIAYDADKDQLHVACSEGVLVSLSAAPEGQTSTEVRRLRLPGDLRDVLVSEGRLLISRFKSAELLILDGEGRITKTIVPPDRTVMSPKAENRSGVSYRNPAVAWRLIEGRKGEALMLHQRASTEELSTERGGYSANGLCDGPVQSVLSPVNTKTLAFGRSPAIPLVTLAIDVAFSPVDHRIAVAAPGNAHTQGANQVSYGLVANLTDQNLGDCATLEQMSPRVTGPAELPPRNDSDAGSRPVADAGTTGGSDADPDSMELPDEANTFRQPGTGNEVIALAFTENGHLVAQLRDPARLEILTTTNMGIDLATRSRHTDTGHRIFHSNSGANLACASCHPEGGEDGRVWNFEKIGARRTQSLQGGILATAPFHWDGDMKDMNHLMTEVFTGRMAGPTLSSELVRTLGRWLDRTPLVPTPKADDAAILRGKALFYDAKVACGSCHGEADAMKNQSIDVGTGKPFQIPSLRGVAGRAPFMHNGCAPTLLDRFTRNDCGGGDKHGVVSHLQPAQIADLVTYLESL